MDPSPGHVAGRVYVGPDGGGPYLKSAGCPPAASVTTVYVMSSLKCTVAPIRFSQYTVLPSKGPSTNTPEVQSIFGCDTRRLSHLRCQRSATGRWLAAPDQTATGGRALPHRVPGGRSRWSPGVSHLRRSALGRNVERVPPRVAAVDTVCPCWTGLPASSRVLYASWHDESPSGEGL